MTTKIISSHGYFRADEAGKVTHRKLSDEFGPRPVFVNWTEWDIAYPGEQRPTEMDILDIGYIDDIGDYVPPCADWRGDRKDGLAENKAKAKRLSDIMSLCKSAELIYVDGLHPTDDWDIDDNTGQGGAALTINYDFGDEERFTASELMDSTPDDGGFRVCNKHGATKLEFYKLSQIHVAPDGEVATC